MAAYIPLKSTNGRMADFQVESVEAEGLQAVRKGGYKKIQLGWKHLDLTWLQANHPELWQKKLEIEKLQRTAFEDYAFGATRGAVFQQIQAGGGLRIENEVFGDTDPEVVWICFDVEALRQFFRFQFDEDDRLEELQVHHNFDASGGLSAAVKAEWERLAELVSGYQSELIRSDGFPRASEWRRLESKSNSDQGVRHLTHRWADTRREFELALVSREVEIGSGSGSEGKITFFGVEATTRDALSGKTNWVVLTATSK